MEKEIEKLRKKMEAVKGIVVNCPELNMDNYSESQVEELNDAMIEIYTLIISAKEMDL